MERSGRLWIRIRICNKLASPILGHPGFRISGSGSPWNIYGSGTQCVDLLHEVSVNWAPDIRVHRFRVKKCIFRNEPRTHVYISYMNFYFILVHTESVFVNVKGDQESTPPAYVAWRAGTTNRVVRTGRRKAENRFLGSIKGLQIRAQYLAPRNFRLDTLQMRNR